MTESKASIIIPPGVTEKERELLEQALTDKDIDLVIEPSTAIAFIGMSHIPNELWILTSNIASQHGLNVRADGRSLLL